MYRLFALDRVGLVLGDANKAVLDEMPIVNHMVDLGRHHGLDIVVDVA